MNKNRKLKTITFTVLTLIILTSMINIVGANKEIVLDFGVRPTIDGIINREADEWNDAVKNKIFLYQNLSNPQNGLEIDFWVVQYKLFLYILVSFELEEHQDHEFVGILISNAESLNPLDYKDAKIVQFLNMTEGVYEYRDYFINQSSFNPDSEIHGAGAASLDTEGKQIVYEFELPVESSIGGDEDIRIETGIYTPFMIMFGESQNYDEEIILMKDVSLFVQFYAFTPILSTEEIIFITLSSVIFTGIGGLYVYYIIQIIKLKDKIEKIRS